MVKNQTILHPASLNLGKGDSRYVSIPFIPSFLVLFPGRWLQFVPEPISNFKATPQSSGAFLRIRV